MNCPKCGQVNADDSIFCAGCGFKLRDPTIATQQPPFPPPPTDPITPKAKNKNAIIIFAVIAVGLFILLMLGIAIGIFVSRLGSRPSVEPTTEPSSYSVAVEELTEAVEIEAEDIPTFSTYYAVKSDDTWTSANSRALSDGGKLVSINSEAEFEEVCRLADDINLKVFWIGAKRGNYQSWDEVNWADGSPITYTHWFNGEPTYISDEGNEENYLMVFKVGDKWYFNDAENDVSSYYSGKMGYIVESSYSQTSVYNSLSSSEKTTLNTFLSNFSEVGYTQGGNYELMEFAYWHNYYNNPYKLYYDHDNNLSGMYADDVDETLYKYFGRTIPRESIASDYITWNYSSGLFTANIGDMGDSAIFTIATNLRENSNGTYTVDFNVYSCYDFSDFGKACYSLSVTEANADYDYLCSGSALIKKKVHNGKNTYEMISYNQ